MSEDELYIEHYNYTFSGELDLSALKDMKVYKKVRSKIKNDELEKAAKNIDFQGIKIGNFENASVSRLVLNEDKDYGYEISLDLNNSELNIMGDYNKWSHENPNTLLKKEELLEITNTFLKKYNIDLSSFGEPRAYVDEKFYSTNSVFFPSLIEGNEIWDEYCGLKGINIVIDGYLKKVYSFHGLEIGINYNETSEFTFENNINNILEVAKIGGRYWLGNNQENVNFITRNLINPKIIYMYIFFNDNNEYKEIISPGIIFEIEDNNSVTDNFPNKVGIPLIREFYKYDANGKIILSSN